MIDMPAGPPFAVECEIPASGSTSDLEIRIVCEPDDEDPPEPAAYKATEEVVELFEAAVNGQAWCPSASDIEYARLKIIERSWVAIPAGWRFHCQINNVAPHSFLPLLAMLTQTHYSYEPLVEVRVAGTGGRIVDADHVLIQRSAVATMPADVPFSVTDERWDGARGLELEVEFTDRLTQNRFAEFDAAMSIWDTLRLLGAFHLDFTEAHELPSAGKTVWMGPQTAHYSVSEFAEGDSALAALVSMLRWQHISGLVLNNVTIA